MQAYRFDSSSKPWIKLILKVSRLILTLSQKIFGSLIKIVVPTLLVTDGNQTTGNDYVYSLIAVTQFSYSWRYNQSIRFKINQLNVNKYAFYKNKFSVELFLQYSGDKNITANLKISQGNAVLVNQNVSFSTSKNTAVVNVLLPADKIGSQVLKQPLVHLKRKKHL
jgi:hypothetical protein